MENLRHTVVADAGHLTNLENLGAFNQALEELLARVGAASSAPPCVGGD